MTSEILHHVQRKILECLDKKTYTGREELQDSLFGHVGFVSFSVWVSNMMKRRWVIAMEKDGKLVYCITPLGRDALHGTTQFPYR